ncbi:MAG: EF-hand domain-containing protein [Paraburkholderia sp.]|uniref:EF-hand domain-containing protein n=1 Tax=Paraburkholderia sp. TaxID=1926495 RepID=UPI00120E10B8|nr:EF-hand domain-containing protein [Paraburkholderia sp.]TAL94838.1 MAG: EF-hand domain-containing protein [Paraburkholderia sp.]
MKKMIAVLVLCIVSATASAQGALPPAETARGQRAMQQLQTRFASANTTHDGKLTREQAAAHMPMVAKHFDEIDTQRVGYVTLPQIEDLMKQSAMAR